MKISKVGEVMWAKSLASNYYDTGITSLAYRDGVLYAAGKRNWSSGLHGLSSVHTHMLKSL